VLTLSVPGLLWQGTPWCFRGEPIGSPRTSGRKLNFKLEKEARRLKVSAPLIRRLDMACARVSQGIPSLPGTDCRQVAREA
jgi:hypothetical protein